MITCATLKQAERCYNYIASQLCHTQFYTVNSGALYARRELRGGERLFALNIGDVLPICQESKHLYFD